MTDRKNTSFLQAEGLAPLPTLLSGPKCTKRFKSLCFELICTTTYYYKPSRGGTKLPSTAARRVWTEYFGRFYDEIPTHDFQYRPYIKSYISDDARLFDIAQWMARQKLLSSEAVQEIDKLAREELIGYRIIGEYEAGETTFVPISDEAEGEANQRDFAELSSNSGAQQHFVQAVEEIKNGHFRGSVAESISGVESVLKVVSGDKSAPFGKALNIVSKDAALHPALKKALEGLYGWSNSPNGMRHALSDESVPVDEPEARFMLSACLAFAAWIKRSV